MSLILVRPGKAPTPVNDRLTGSLIQMRGDGVEPVDQIVMKRCLSVPAGRRFVSRLQIL